MILKNKYGKNNPVDHQSIMKYLNFERWDFKVVNDGLPHQYPGIFLRSEYCMIKILTIQDRPLEEPDVFFKYGRLHAPLNRDTMIWNGEKHYCWHSIDKVLLFFEELSLADTKNMMFKKPRIMKEIYELNKSKGWKPGEYAALEQSLIWEKYGQRLFNLFDLRQQNLWNEYADFLKEFYKIQDEKIRLKGRTPRPSVPPLYKVC